MICEKIKQDYKQCNASHLGRWVQRVVLINKQDVSDFHIENFRISFELEQEKRGYSYEYPNVLFQVLGNYQEEEKNNYAQYKQSVQLPLSGLDFNTSPINNGEFFAVLMDSNNRIWVFGFDYGLKPNPYKFENNELNTITLTSVVDEDVPPLLYISESNGITDFNSNFKGTEMVTLQGQFSDDYNEDYWI